MEGELWKSSSKRVPSLAYIYSLCFHQKDMCEVNVIDYKTLLYTLSSYNESSFLQRLKQLWLEVCLFYSATLNLSYNIIKATNGPESYLEETWL